MNDTIKIKPKWIKVKGPSSSKVSDLKNLLRQHNLHTVCESAACPNIVECFSAGTATFMILGNICTRNCKFCNIEHGKPNAINLEEPENLAHIIKKMQLNYVVITSVNRDDLKDGGAKHFANCISAIHQHCKTTKIEILTPDFKQNQENAIEILHKLPITTFNHNVETVPKLHKTIKPGSNYAKSLSLLKNFKSANPQILTKSGLMLGLGETIKEVKEVLYDLRANNCDLITIGQYLAPSNANTKVVRYATIEEFKELEEYAKNLGFTNVASGPLVRSSYHAAIQVQSTS